MVNRARRLLFSPDARGGGYLSNATALVGGPSEGAGGSQQESPGIGTAWRDARRLVSVRIPSAAMGVQRARTGADATGENRGWLGRVEEILSARELPLDAGRPKGRDRA